MVVWLRNRQVPGQGAVGVDAGAHGAVVRREALARLATLDEALVQVRSDCVAQLDEARREAGALVEDTRMRVEQLLADAERRFEQSARLGYAAGRKQALDEWHAAAARGMVENSEALARMHDRLARVVVQAVEQVVATSDRAALYRRVGVLLDKAIADTSFMTVVVPTDDAEQARGAFDEIAAESGWRMPVEVIGDDRLPAGSCLCEWDYGSLDASLDRQLAAIRRAVRRGVERLGFAARQADAEHAQAMDGADEGREVQPGESYGVAQPGYDPEQVQYGDERSADDGYAADGAVDGEEGYESDDDEGAPR